MDKYFFISGHRLGLSIAEVFNYLTVRDIPFTLVDFGKDFFVIEGDFKSIDFDILGGLVKVGLISEIFSFNDFSSDKALDSFSREIKSTGLAKASVALSLRGNVNRIRLDKKGVLMDLKRALAQNDIGVRFPGDMKSLVTSNVVVDKKVIGKGVDFEVLVSDRCIYVGKTSWVQDYEAFRKRDYDRPFYDAKSGMLPPKLARIMINLGDTGNVQTIWDPFCGSGTVLMEALDMDYNVVGTDISDRAVKNSKGNIDWLMGVLDTEKSKNEQGSTGVNEPSKEEDQFVFIKQSIIMGIHKVYNELGIEINRDIAFVTEPFLGPPVLRVLNPAQVNAILDNVYNIYLEFIEKIVYIDKQLKKPINSLVLVVPEYRTTTGWTPLHLGKEIKTLNKIGFYPPKWFETLQKKIPNFDMYWVRQESLIRRKILVLHKVRNDGQAA